MKKPFLLSILALTCFFGTPVDAMERKRKREEEKPQIATELVTQETKKSKTESSRTIAKKQIFPETWPVTEKKSLRQITKEKIIKQLIDQNFENIRNVFAGIPEELRTEIANERLYNGNTLLHLITDPDAIKLLLQAGSDLQITNNDGQSVLNYYIAQDKLNAAHRLLEFPIKFNLISRDVLANNPLIYAIKQGDFELVTKIIEYAKNMNSDVAPTEIEEQTTILNLSGMINSPNIAHRTPFTLAIRNGAPLEIIQLLGKWARINQLINNETPLMVAAIYNPRAIKTLIDLGAKPNIQNNEGQSPLILAAEYNPKSIKPLIEGGALVDAQNTTQHETALMRAGSVEAAQELLQAGANINFVNSKGLSALTYAIHNLSEDFESEELRNLIIYLLEHDAQIHDIDIKEAEETEAMAREAAESEEREESTEVPDILEILQRYPKQRVKE